MKRHSYNIWPCDWKINSLYLAPLSNTFFKTVSKKWIHCHNLLWFKERLGCTISGCTSWQIEAFHPCFGNVLNLLLHNGFLTALESVDSAQHLGSKRATSFHKTAKNDAAKTEHASSWEWKAKCTPAKAQNKQNNDLVLLIKLSIKRKQEKHCEVAYKNGNALWVTFWQHWTKIKINIRLATKRWRKK